MSVLTFVQPTLWFCCQVNSKGPKVDCFCYTLLVTITLVCGSRTRMIELTYFPNFIALHFSEEKKATTFHTVQYS